MRKAVFFDRDGVLNQAVLINGRPHPPADEHSQIIQQGADDCIARLQSAGYLCICVTNQPDFSRKKRTAENIAAMNNKIMRVLQLDDLYCCLHDNEDHCDCRKPKPGMLLRAAQKWTVDLRQSWMIGDRRSDILAGQAAGCRTIFIDGGYDDAGALHPDSTCRSVAEVADIILSKAHGEQQ